MMPIIWIKDRTQLEEPEPPKAEPQRDPRCCFFRPEAVWRHSPGPGDPMPLLHLGFLRHGRWWFPLVL